MSAKRFLSRFGSVSSFFNKIQTELSFGNSRHMGGPGLSFNISCV